MPVEKLYRGSVVASAEELAAAANEEGYPPGGGGGEGGEGDAESVDGYQTDVLTYDTNTGVIEKAPPSASAELMQPQAR